MNLVFYLFIMGLISLTFIRKHVLLCLMSLEFIVLSLLLMIFLFCTSYFFSFYIFVFFMTFYVCEGVLGLSVLISMIRCYGNDYMNSMFLW
uniref:NADH-ubiquinone oxidoreductase chain 4L n=1 Tax=Mileewa sharpa TaxID=2984023 RepID=A0A977TM26_9HEMI|nr:NADH dehydrogenase subunit 4L [Mileewa sharpa]UXX17562.1 NADH dehydrogenase subunit 4L [Mileewa sharpa]